MDLTTKENIQYITTAILLGQSIETLSDMFDIKYIIRSVVIAETWGGYDLEDETTKKVLQFISNVRETYPPKEYPELWI